MTLNGAITQLVEMRENSMMPEVFKPYFDKVIETVSECEEPSAQPELKRGKWVFSTNNMGYRCSLCNAQAPFWCMAGTQNLSNYCPNCGARMEES